MSQPVPSPIDYRLCPLYVLYTTPPEYITRAIKTTTITTTTARFITAGYVVYQLPRGVMPHTRTMTLQDTTWMIP